ncbi:MAG: ABC transporter permease [Proteobacteria bacterium]|nr:ABC transporter permease [Pseudomonadota bacterium]
MTFGHEHRPLSQRMTRLALWVITILVLTYLIAPLLAIIPLSFSSSAFLNYPIPSFSLHWYEDFFSSPEWRLAIWNSLVVGSITALLATSLGTLAALGLNRADFPFKRVITGFFISPLVVPVIILAVGTYFFFAPLRLTGTYTGIILAHTTMAIPFVVITVGATLTGLDENLVRAAFSLGAHPVRVFFKVILPLVLPGVISGAVIAFATSLDEVVMILFLAGPEQNTIPRQMFNGIKYYLSPTITAVATVLVVVSIAILGLVGLLRRRMEKLRASAAEH